MFITSLSHLANIISFPLTNVLWCMYHCFIIVTLYMCSGRFCNIFVFLSHYIFNLLGRFSIVFSVHSQIFSFHMILVQWANSVVLIIVMTNFDQLSYDWFLVREIRLWKVRVSNRRELTWLYYYDNRAGETGGEGRGDIPPPTFSQKKEKNRKDRETERVWKKKKRL